NKNSLASALQLKGLWKKSLAARDIIIACGVLGGGIWMLYEIFRGKMEKVTHQ
nr:6K2 protein [Brugmansia suaveolens mottle virus]